MRTVLTLTVLAILAMMTFAAETPTGRFLHRTTVEIPARMLDRIGRGHVIAAVLIVLFCGLLVWAGGADGVRVIAFGLPDAAAWLTTFEVSAYVDMIAAVLATAATLRLKGLGARIGTTLTGIVRRRSGTARPRACRSRTHAAPANDDDSMAPDDIRPDLRFRPEALALTA